MDHPAFNFLLGMLIGIGVIAIICVFGYFFGNTIEKWYKSLKKPQTAWQFEKEVFFHEIVSGDVIQYGTHLFFETTERVGPVLNNITSIGTMYDSFGRVLQTNVEINTRAGERVKKYRRSA